MDEEDEPAVAVEDGGAPSESSDDSGESDNDEPVGLTAVAGDSTQAPVDEIESTSLATNKPKQFSKCARRYQG